MDKKKTNPIDLARFRYVVLFPILNLEGGFERGDQAQMLREISEKTYFFPGEETPRRISERTLKRWLAKLRKDEKRPIEPAQSLLRSERRDKGTHRKLTQVQMKWLRESHSSFPRWSYTLHSLNLNCSGLEPICSRSTVYRWMKKEGLCPLTRQSGVRKKNKLLFESEFPGELVHFDFHTSNEVSILQDGKWIKPKCVAFIDDRSRFILHIQWFLSETTSDLVHAKIQSYLKHGICMRDMSDNGSAMISAEYQRGLKVLGVEHERTVPRSPYQNGKIESFWQPLEGQLMAMLSNVENLSLKALNEATIAWVEQAYNCSKHKEIQASPRSIWFGANNTARRPSPDWERLKRCFRRKATRKQRQEDHTISIENTRYQIPSHLFGHEIITVVYAKWNRDLVTIIDPSSERELVDIYPVDKVRNAQRRTLPAKTQSSVQVQSHFLDPLSSPDVPPYLKTLLKKHRKRPLRSLVVPKPELIPFQVETSSKTEVREKM